MKHWLQQRLRMYRVYGLAGLGVWAVIAPAAWQYSRGAHIPYLPTLVTWAEWVVAVLLLPWLGTLGLAAASNMTRSSRMSTAMQNVMYGGSVEQVANTVSEELARDTAAPRFGVVAKLSTVAVVVFVVDLLVRGLFGLGWQPFV